MNKKILIDGTNIKEVRIALMDNGFLTELSYETQAKIQNRNNIYLAYVTRVEPALQAAFVDYGNGKHGFVPFDEISKTYYKIKDKNDAMSIGNRRNKPAIQNVICVGQRMLVQVIKDERRNKGVTLTTFIALTGHICIFLPNTPPSENGFRKQFLSDTQKSPIIDLIHKSDTSTLIIRPNAPTVSVKTIKREYERLNKIWQAIQYTEENTISSGLLYEEGNAIIRAINDFINSADEIIVEGHEIYGTIMEHSKLAFYCEHNKNKIKFHKHHIPLFTYYNIEPQIDKLYSHNLTLPSGGSVIIGITEALIAIDVNSGKMTRNTADIESTALKTNLEAVCEIARQLRLRNLSGIIIIDLISMSSYSNKRIVEAELKKSMAFDRAKVNISKINEFGLLGLSRQRIGMGFHELNSVLCPSCHGAGAVQSILSTAEIFSKTLKRILTQYKYKIINVKLSKQLMTYIINNHAKLIAELQNICSTKINYEVSEDMEGHEYAFFSNNIVINPNNPLEQNILSSLTEEYLTQKY